MKKIRLFFVFLALACFYSLNGCTNTTPGDSELTAQFKPLVGNDGTAAGEDTPMFIVEKVTKTNGQKISDTEYIVDCAAQVKFLTDYDTIKEKTLNQAKKNKPEANKIEWGLMADMEMGSLNDKSGGPWEKAGETRTIKYSGIDFVKTEKGWMLAK